MRSPSLAAADLRPLAGFWLFATWFSVLPCAAVSNSTAVHAHALFLGCASLLALALAAALDGIGARRERGGRALLAFWSVLGAAAGIAFLALSSPTARVACFCLETAAAAGLALFWGRVFSAQAFRTVLVGSVGALACIGAIHFGVIALGSATGILGNSHALSNLTLGVLALLPLASGALGWREPADSTPEASAPADSAPAVPLTCLAVLCLASTLTSLISGFTYLPYRFDWVMEANLHSAIVLPAVLAAGVLVARKPKPGAAFVNGFLLFSLLLTVLGLSLLSLGATDASFAARGMMSAARDCYFVLAIVLLCCLSGGGRMRFFPGFALGLAGTGAYWGCFLGIALKQLLGYDPEFLAPVCTACVGLLALASLQTLVGASLRPKEGVGEMATRTTMPPAAAGVADGKQAAAGETVEGTNCGRIVPSSTADGGNTLEATAPERGVLENARGDAAPSTTTPESASSTPAAFASAPVAGETAMDATLAQRVIEQSYEKALAPYALSPRETQVALLVVEGSTAAVAAEKLGISIATVKFHLGNAYRKLGIQSKAELIQMAKQGAAANAAKPDAAAESNPDSLANTEAAGATKAAKVAATLDEGEASHATC